MTTTHDELLGAIAELRTLFPDWRMGQLIGNLVQATGSDGDGAIWDVEDEQLLVVARRLIVRNQTRQTVQASQ